MIKIYHNPRCGKSREGLEILNNSGSDFVVIDYMKEGVSKMEIRQLLKLLGIGAEMLVRKNEPLWKTLTKDKTLTNTQIFNILATNPNLIQRPIVINNNKAKLGRPASAILELL